MAFACAFAACLYCVQVIPKSRPPVVFHLSFANSPSSPYTEYNLIISNLADETTDDDLFKVPPEFFI